MKNNTFDYWPDEQMHEVAVGLRSDGNPISGKWFNYPEMGQAVFWISRGDMAKFVSEIILTYNGKSEKIISPAMVQMMLSPQIENQGPGVNLGDDGKARFYFYHLEAVEGYQTFMVDYPKRGQEAIIMTNGD